MSTYKNNIEFRICWSPALFAILKGYHHQVTLHIVPDCKFLNNTVSSDVWFEILPGTTFQMIWFGSQLHSDKSW